MFKRMLVVLDPESHPEAAIQHGLALAGARLVELVFYSALMPPSQAVDLPDADLSAQWDLLADQRRHTERQHRHAQQLAEDHGLLSRSVISMADDLGRGVLATAHTSHSDLVMAPCDGSNAIVRLLNGSILPGLVTASRVPVMVCAHANPAALAMGPAMRRILVMLEDGDAAGVALAQGLDLARASGAELRLVHIKQPDLMPVVDAMGFVADTPEGLADEIQGVSQRMLASAQAAATKARLTSHGISMPAGTTARDIARMATDQACGLIVVAHRGGNALLRLLTGSLIPGLITAATTPVLICPEPEQPPFRRPTRRRHHRNRSPAATAVPGAAHGSDH